MSGRWAPAVILSVLLSALIPLWLGGSDQLLDQLAAFPLSGLALLLGMVCVGWCFNAARLRLLTAGLGLRLGAADALRCVVSAEFAGTATPAYAGAPATYMLLLKRRGLSLSAAGAVVALDQVTDLVFFATALPIVAVVLAGGHWVPNSWLLWAGVLPVLGTGLLLWLPRHYRPIVLAVGPVLRRVPGLRRLRWRMARALIRFRVSIRLVLSNPPGRLVAIYAFCCCHWLLRYGLLPVTFHFLGQDLSWSYLFLVQAVTLLAGHLSLLPGGTGGVELGYGVLLGPYLDAATLAAGLLIWRFCLFHWFLIVGAPVFITTIGRRGAAAAVSRRV